LFDSRKTLPVDSEQRCTFIFISGCPPGKYRVAVEQLHNRNDVFKGAFGLERTPFVREIRSSRDELTIDLDRAQ
jgi:hypothetical protein